MKTRSYALSSLLTLPLFATACVTGEDPPLPSPSSEAPAPETSAAETANATELETLLRKIERGQDLKQASAGLEALLADRALTAEQRIDVQLAQSRAHEKLGDTELAIATVEALLSEHGADRRFAQRDEATKRLRRLLTGKEDEGRATPRAEPVPPIAKGLAKYFPLDDGHKAEVDILTFGPDHGHGDQLGIYNIGSAHREILENECPLCEVHTSVSTSKSSSGSWTSVPSTIKNHRGAGIALGDDNPTIGSSLVFFYYDLDAHRVPSRYDEYLAMPSDEIAAELERGRGVIAAREREGAPPVIVLAAPRMGQLRPVFEAFAQMDELPTEPVFVDVAPNLTPDEIRNIIRTSRGKLKACYETLLERAPTASGKIDIRFAIDADGKVGEAVADGGATDLSDPDLEACLAEVASKLTFPKTGEETTVTYPLVMTPG